MPTANEPVRPEVPPTPSIVPRHSPRTILVVLVVLVVGIAISRHRSEKKDEQPQTQTPTAEPAKSVADSRAEILNDALKTARAKYVDKTQDEFRNQGVDATISDSDGELIVVSDVLKQKPSRDQLMRSTFDPAYRNGLCAAGFRTVKLTSGILFGDGDTYSLDCPETKEERQARLEAQKGKRQEFVDQLQRSFNSDSEVAALNIRVEQGTNDLILTSPSTKDVSPRVFKSMFAAGFGDVSSSNLCGVGFRGLRVRSSASSGGTFISFDCGRTGN